MPGKQTKVQDQEQQEPIAPREPGEDPGEHFVEANPRSWANNNAAGVEYLTQKDPYRFLIRFKEKPPREVISHMKEQGFQWDRDSQVWARPVAYKTAAQDREIGRRTYGKVVDMVLEEKGMAPQRDAF